MKIPEKVFNYSLRITLYETNFSFSYVKNSVAMLSSCLPLNLPCDFPSRREQEKCAHASMNNISVGIAARRIMLF